MTTSRSSFDPTAFWEERLAPFDVSAVGYLGLGRRYNEWLYRVRSVVFRRLVRRLEVDFGTTRVLDVGSGTGFYVSEWRRAGVWRLVGSDLTRVATERLAAVYPTVDFVRFDVSEEPPFPPGSFDVISSFDVLYHVLDDRRYEAALANLAALVRPGGYLLFSENFLHGPARRDRHQVSRSLVQIERILSEVGLEVVVRRPMFALMNAPLDSDSALLHGFWHRLRRLIKRSEAAGATVGALLFPLEVLLVALLREGPSTEAMVCRKPSVHPELRRPSPSAG
jgi:SAM-dependent methyltransferase